MADKPSTLSPFCKSAAQNPKPLKLCADFQAEYDAVADIYYCACTSGVCYTLNTFYKANSRVLAADGDSVPTPHTRATQCPHPLRVVTAYTLIRGCPRPYTLDRAHTPHDPFEP